MPTENTSPEELKPSEWQTSNDPLEAGTGIPSAERCQEWFQLMVCGEELLKWNQTTNDRACVQDAVSCFRNALSISHQADVAGTLGGLGIALLTRFEQVGDCADLDDSVVNFQAALELTPDDHPNSFGLLGNLANALIARFRLGKDFADLDHAIISNQSALKLRPLGHHDRSLGLNNLASALLTRFEKAGEVVDLSEAVVTYRNALELRPPGHPNRFLSLLNLGGALRLRFFQLGDLADLEEAIVSHQSACELAPVGHPERPSSLSDLATTLRMRFKRLGDRADLEEAISKHQRALELTPSGHPKQSSYLRDLADALENRFMHFGDPSSLEAAIFNYESALELIPIGSADRAEGLNNLGEALISRFELIGDRVDLEKAIAIYHTALELAVPGHIHHSLSLNNLASALMARFRHAGDLADLEAAILHYQNALELRPTDHPYRSISLDNLAVALMSRFEHVKNRADVDEAIVKYQSALELRPTGHPDRFSTLHNLGDALRLRFQHVGRDADPDLDTAIGNHQNALILAPPGHPYRPMMLHNLANAFITRFDRDKDLPDLDEAIVKYQMALELMPLGNPYRAVILRRLATNLFFRLEIYTRLSSDYYISPSEACDDRKRVIGLLKEASLTANSGATFNRLDASLFWGAIAVHWDDPSALESFSTSLELLDMFVASGRTLESSHIRLKTAELRRVRTLAVDGAACALGSGQTELAVELLDQGQSVLLTQAGKYRKQIDELEQIDPQLAEEFKVTSLLMEESVLSAGVVDVRKAVSGTQDVVGRFQRLSERWTIAVEQIRCIDGFKSFLKPIPFDVLRKAAVGGPVIVLIISKKGSNAIIVHSEADPGPYVVPLAEASPDLLSGLLAKTSSKTSQEDFKFILLRIWELIVKPIVEVLQKFVRLPPRSRIWWCPTGAASHLPLHAAGDYVNRGQVLPNLYISSYTTTLSSLINSRKKVVHRVNGGPRLLIIGQARVPGKAEIKTGKQEVDRLKNLFPSSLILEDDAGTREAITRTMVEYEWLHLTCHGYVDQIKPFNSYFAVIDGPLTFQEILKRGLPNADLAFLSACHSAAGNQDQSEEALHLAAGLQFAGYRSVVGTLWEMAENTGPLVAQKFWSSVKESEQRGEDATKMSAKALHCAVAALRKANVSIADWACFVHYGC